MSPLSDYEDEMFRATMADREIEQLLSGVPAEDGVLNDLAPFVDMLRSQGMRAPSDAAVDSFAAEAAAIVLAGRSTRVAGSASRSRSRRSLLRPQLAAVLATIVLLTGMTGVAVAADPAAPGDTLYGLDRALEEIGIGAGKAGERLEEAHTLVADGQAQLALEHVTEAFDEAEKEGDEVADLQDARVAISDAAAMIVDANEDSDNAAIMQGNVALLLEYLSNNLGKDVGVDGREFGQGVAELARNISKSDDTDEPVNDTSVPPEDTESDDPGPPEVIPGNPGGSGNGNGNGNSGGNGNGNSGGNGSGNSGGNGNGNGNGGNSGGNGPPDGSPSETAPGRGNQP